MASMGSIAARRMQAEQQLTRNIQEISREMGMEVVRLPITARQPELQHVQRMEALVDWTNKLKDLLGEGVMAAEGTIPLDTEENEGMTGETEEHDLPPSPPEGSSEMFLPPPPPQPPQAKESGSLLKQTKSTDK